MAQEIKALAARSSPAFRLGRKQIFLPNHVITFLRKDFLPPNEACFKVPLRFTKFDLRDYLWNLYNVEVRKVRSYVKESPIARRSPWSRATYRPLPSKIMTVELVKPFQWPEHQSDLGPWNHDLWKRREEMLETASQDQYMTERMALPMKSRQPLSDERKELAALAGKLASGEVRWTNDVQLDPRWDKLSQARKATEATDARPVTHEAKKEAGLTSENDARPSSS